MNNIIGGHEAEMDALADLEASAEARSIRLRFAARDLIAAAVTLNEIANGCWEPGLPDLFGETKTKDQARQHALYEIERCARIIAKFSEG